MILLIVSLFAIGFITVAILWWLVRRDLRDAKREG